MTPQSSESRKAAEAVFVQWAEGELGANELAAHVGEVDDPDLVGDRLLSSLGLAEVEHDVRTDDVAGAWRWAHTDNWRLSEQDEDLVAAHLPLHVLVRAAVSTECVKRDFCRDAAIDQMRNRINDAARFGHPELRAEIGQLREELSAVPEAHGKPPATYLDEVEAAKDAPLNTLDDSIELARLVGRCCFRPPSEFEVRPVGRGYHITNIDNHHSGLAVAGGRWMVTHSAQPEPPEAWWREGPSRGAGLEL